MPDSIVYPEVPAANFDFAKPVEFAVTVCVPAFNEKAAERIAAKMRELWAGTVVAVARIVYPDPTPSVEEVETALGRLSDADRAALITKYAEPMISQRVSEAIRPAPEILSNEAQNAPTIISSDPKDLPVGVFKDTASGAKVTVVALLSDASYRVRNVDTAEVSDVPMVVWSSAFEAA